MGFVFATRVPRTRRPMLGLLSGLVALPLAVAPTGVVHASQLLDKVYACETHGTKTPRCMTVCRALKSKNFPDTPTDTMVYCKTLINDTELKPLDSQACSATSCIIRLSRKSASTAAEVYAGGDYFVRITRAALYDGDIPSAFEEYTATIDAHGRTTVITALIDNHGNIQPWETKSGVRGASIKFIGKDAVLTMPRL